MHSIARKALPIFVLVLFCSCGTYHYSASEKRATTEAGFEQNRPSATNPATPTLLAHALKIPADALVDATDVYWREANDRIMRVSKNGGEPVTIVSAERVLAFAVDGTSVYYLTDTELKKIDKGGGSPLVLVAKLRNFSPGARIALDEGDVYWLAGNENPIPSVRREGKDQLMKVSKSGGESVLLAPHVYYAESMAVDTKHVYWSGWDHVLRRVGKSGGEPEVLVRENESYPLEITADQASIYWMDPTGPIIKLDKNTEKVSKILRQQQERSYHLVNDEASLYWVNRDSGRIMKLSKNGGKALSLVDDQDPTSIAVDERYIYWTDARRSAVLKLPK